MSLGFLRDHLRGGARPVARGHVRVDVSRALEKLRDHRLADPSHWVLEVLRAAVGSGATRVQVATEGGAVTVSFDGVPFPEGGLAALFDHALGGGAGADASRLRFLGLGVNGALASRPERVEVRSGATLLRVEPPDRLEVGPAEAENAGGEIEVTRVIVVGRDAWGGLRKSKFGTHEATAIRARAPFFPVELRVDGDRADRPPEPGGAVLARMERGGGTRRICVALPWPPPGHAILTLDVAGVHVVTRYITGVVVPVWAWARDDRLQRDASGSNVVEGDPIAAGLESEVASLAEAMIGELALHPPELGAGAVRGLLQRLALQLSWRVGPAAASGRLQAILDEAPILPDPSGGWLSLATIAAEHAAGRPVRIAGRRHAAGSYQPPVVLLERDSPLGALLPPGRKVDIEDEVRAWSRREESRRRFEAQPVEEARLPRDLARLASAEISGEGFTGEVAVVNSATTALVRFLRGGRLLQQQSVEALAPLRIRAVVDSAALSPDDSWRGVRADAAFDAAVTAITTAVITAIGSALRAPPGRLDGPEGRPRTTALQGEARTLVALLAKNGWLLPPELAAARIWELAGGDMASVVDLRANGCDRYVGAAWPHPALDGRPVVVASLEHRAALVGYVGRELENHVGPLLKEADVRRRMAAPQAAVVRASSGIVAVTPVSGEGIEGELGLRPGGESVVTLRLLRAGVLLEERMLPALYGPVLAAVDAPALTPKAGWGAVAEDAVFERVLQSIRLAERSLCSVLLEQDLRHERFETVGMRTYLQNFVLEERTLAQLGLGVGGEDGAAPDALVASASRAPVFKTTGALESLDDIVARARTAGRLCRLDPATRVDVPPELVVVRAGQKEAAQIAALAGVPCVDALSEIQRARTLAAFLARPEVERALPADAAPRAKIDAPSFRAEMAWAGPEGRGRDPEAGPPHARVQIHHARRFLCALHVPVRIGLLFSVDFDSSDFDPAAGRLPSKNIDELNEAIRRAEDDLVRGALGDRERWQPLLLEALAAWSGSEWPPGGPAVLRCQFVPTTDGRRLAPDELERAEQIPYTTAPHEGELPGRRFVLAAATPVMHRIVGLWRVKAEDVTGALAREIAQRRARLEKAPVEEVRVEGRALRRASFSVGAGRAAVTGEVVLREEAVPARLWLLHERRPVTSHEVALPPGTAAAVDGDGFRLTAGGADVERGPEHDRVVRLVEIQLERLGAAIAREWDDLDEGARAALTEPLARLAAWMLGRGGRDPKAFDPHRTKLILFDLPLLRSTDGRTLSFRQLLNARDHGPVPYARVAGTLPGDWTWWPRPHEQALAGDAFVLEDVTEDMTRVAAMRSSPPVEDLRVPVEGPWRERIDGRAGETAIEGELVLGLGPATGRSLVVELYRERRLLEEVTLRRTFEGRARVSCDALRPDRRHRRAERDEAYAAVRAAVTAALERLVAHIFREAAPAEWRSLLAVAARWRLGKGGPVADALAALAPFTDVSGAPVTLGRLLAEASERGQVSIVGERWAAAAGATGSFMLRVSVEDLWLLKALRVTTHDVTAEVMEAGQRVAKREARRLGSLRWEGRALVRVSIDRDGWRGELALPEPPDWASQIRLARQGVAEDWFATDLGVAGVLDHDSLPVDEDAQRALLGTDERIAIQAAVDDLFGALATEMAPPSRPGDAAVALARSYALRYLATHGVSSAQQLDRLSGAAEALASAQLFPTADGQRVDLRAIAARVLRHGFVEIVTGRLEPDEVQGDVVLREVASWAAWIDQLVRILGASAVRLQEADVWRAARAEADPAPESPLGIGLRRLRRVAELLYAGASGALRVEELKGVLLRRGSGKRAVRYDARRGLALLDPAHPLVSRALEEADARPERLYVLAAAIYGAINRALERVTDEDEVRLCGALLAHLDSNPHLLAVDATTIVR